MNICINTNHLRELVYEMMRNLQDGEYMDNSGICRGMLNAEETAALDDLIFKIEGMVE